MIGRTASLSPDTVKRSGLCIGCGSCVAQQHEQDKQHPEAPAARALSHAPVFMRLDRFGELEPAGPPGWLGAGPRGFARTCPFSPLSQDETLLANHLFAMPESEQDERVGRYRSAWVGHAAEHGHRERGSSGGMLGWTAAELLRAGWVDAVAHVVPAEGGRLFRYGFSRTEAELARGAKSRYYPVELSEVIDTIRRVPGRYAVTGVPCFIKALQLLRREDATLRARIVVTLGLFCGHMKSTRLIESFAFQMGVPMAQVRDADFRHKDAHRPANWYTARFALADGTSRQRDWFHLLEGDWGAGFFQNAACDACDDVMAETADIAFGDAWVEPYSQDGRGTNVVVVRDSALHTLLSEAIDQGRLALSAVDADFVARTQAAGLRQRREGLAYRLATRRGGVHPHKRVAPSPRLVLRRRLIYRLRMAIGRWSRRLYHLSRNLQVYWLYAAWARATMILYRGLAYPTGRTGRILGLLLPEYASTDSATGQLRSKPPG